MSGKILIIDDDVDTLRLVGLLLERQGFDIIAADNGNQGLAKAISDQPNLILLDVMMPDVDGFEVARKLRQQEETRNIPVIFFTAKTQVEDKVTGFEVGGDDYLTKPVHPKELTARVNALLARSSPPRPAAPVAELPHGTIIGILTARGGVGVTTMALNLGIVLHNDSREEVIVAELRPGQGTIALDLGYPNLTGLNTLLEKNAEQISQADVECELVEHTSGIRLLMASNQPSDARHIPAVHQFERIVRHLRTMAKFTILDLGPAIPPTTDRLLEFCDQIVVLVEPEPNAVSHTKALLDDLNLRVLGLNRINVAIVSRMRSDLKLTRTQIQDQLGHSSTFVFTPVPELAYQAAIAKVPLIQFRAGESSTQLHNNLQQFKALAQTLVKHGQKVR